MAIRSHKSATPEAVKDLIRDGFIALDRPDIVALFADMDSNVKFEVFDDVPSSINGIGIQGKFPLTSTTRRRGLYYTPAVTKYLPTTEGTKIDTLYHALIAAGDTFTIAMNRVDIREGNPLDVLTLAKYESCQENAFAAHTDYGFITIGISNEFGLEICIEGTWVRVPANTLYVHTGQWLQRILQKEGFATIGKALHRVSGCTNNRVFAGLFYEPGFNHSFNGKTYGQFIAEQFASTYNGEHPAV
jgi:hypothetical protein